MDDAIFFFFFLSLIIFLGWGMGDWEMGDWGRYMHSVDDPWQVWVMLRTSKRV